MLQADKNNKNKLTLLVISILTVILGIASALYEIMLLPFSGALLAILLLCENNEKRLFSFVVPILITAVCAFASLQNTFFALSLIASAVILAVYFAKDYSKSECAFILVFIFTLTIFFVFILSAYNSTGLFTVESITEYYIDLYESTKPMFVEELVNVFAEMQKSDPTMSVYGEITTEDIEAVFDMVIAHIPAMVITVALFCAGIMLKVFTFVTKRIFKGQIKNTGWVFDTPIIFAYFYVAISIIGIFFNDGSTLANAISNLMLILMLVYAYIGARTVLRIGRLMNRRGLLIAAIILSVLFLNLIAIEIYSFAGVFFTISNKKITTK